MFGLVFSSKAVAMSFRKILRMMQPPRHMRAMDAKSRFQAKASDARCNTANP